jgi:O-antigen ligase
VEVDLSPLRIAFNKTVISKLRNWRQHLYLLVFLLPFFLVLLSFWQTYDWVYWFIRLRVKLSFLLLPLAFLFLGKFSKNQANLIYLVFISLMSVTNLVILYYALIDWNTTIDNLLIGQAMWTPCDHIRYSLLLVTSIILGAYLTLTNWPSRNAYVKYTLVALTFFSFFFLHFLAVKSGLLVLYLTVIALLFYYIVKFRKWLSGSIALLVFVGAIAVLFLTVPTLQKKVAYTMYDLHMFLKGEGEEYSDSGRLAALDVGWQVAKNDLVLGVGAGNLRYEVAEKFREQYPLYKEIFMPPNQFLFVLAGTGLWGLLLFMFSLFYPLFYHKNYHRPLFLAFFISQFLSLLLEHALENTVGIFHYLLFMLLILSTVHDSPSNSLPR